MQSCMSSKMEGHLSLEVQGQLVWHSNTCLKKRKNYDGFESATWNAEYTISNHFIAFTTVSYINRRTILLAVDWKESFVSQKWDLTA